VLLVVLAGVFAAHAHIGSHFMTLSATFTGVSLELSLDLLLQQNNAPRVGLNQSIFVVFPHMRCSPNFRWSCDPLSLELSLDMNIVTLSGLVLLEFVTRHKCYLFLQSMSYFLMP
jgi:hypothetical protein